MEPTSHRPIPAPFPKNALDLINNARIHCLNEIIARGDSAQANQALQIMPALYVLARNFLSAGSAAEKSLFDDQLVLGRNCGKTLAKSFFALAGLGETLPSGVHDLSDRQEEGAALAFAAGLALNRKMLNARLKEGCFDNKTYCVLSQAELSSPDFAPTLNLAGANGLGGLVCLADFSGFDANGPIAAHSAADFRMLVEAFGWKYYEVDAGANFRLIDRTLQKAALSSRPAFVAIHTVAGHGSSRAGSIESFGQLIDANELGLIKERFALSAAPEEFERQFRSDVGENWAARMKSRRARQDRLIRSNQALRDLLVTPKAPQTPSPFKKGKSVAEALLDASALNLVFLVGTDWAVPAGLAREPRLFVAKGCEAIVFRVMEAIAQAGYFDPFLVGDLNGLGAFARHWQGANAESMPFRYFVTDDLSALHSRTVEMNALRALGVDAVFLHDLFGLNRFWDEHEKGARTVYLVGPSATQTDAHETWAKSDRRPDCAVLNYGLDPRTVHRLLACMAKRRIECAVASVTRSSALPGGFDPDPGVPLVLLNVGPGHWIDSLGQNVLAAKHVVKFNDEDFERLCAELKA